MTKRTRIALRAIAWMTALWLGTSIAGRCDIGIPMIFPTLYLMIPALIPVVLIETAIASRLARKPFREPLKGIAVANAVSTLVGIPLAWGGITYLSFFLGFLFPHLGEHLSEHWQNVLLHTSWLWPDEPAWVILTAQLILFVPFFFISSWIESAIVCRFITGISIDEIKPAIFRANIGSYLFLVCIAIILFMR